MGKLHQTAILTEANGSQKSGQNVHFNREYKTCWVLWRAGEEMVYLRRHVTKISKNEGSLYIKTAGYDILCILACESLTLFDRETLPHTLFIICELNYKWHLKYILQISMMKERMMLVCSGYDIDMCVREIERVVVTW